MYECSHTTAYGISVCERMLMNTFAYARKRWYMLGVRSAYVVYVPKTLTYVGVRCVIRRDRIVFWTMFKIYQYMRAYRIYVTHTLAIRTAYAGFARHTLKLRYPYMCTLRITLNLAVCLANIAWVTNKNAESYTDVSNS